MVVDGLHWLGHASFRWEGPKTIYFDPWKLSKDSRKSDIICVSHEHFDHMSKADIVNITTADTVIVTCKACADELSRTKIACKEIKAMAPGGSIELGGIKISDRKSVV